VGKKKGGSMIVTRKKEKGEAKLWEKGKFSCLSTHREQGKKKFLNEEAIRRQSCLGGKKRRKTKRREEKELMFAKKKKGIYSNERGRRMMTNKTGEKGDLKVAGGKGGKKKASKRFWDL